jgi:putative pyruvate formate lyase activating enzyme
MVYLGGCNFRCSFCTQAPACFRPAEGLALTAPETLERIKELAGGVRWINLVGGEPSLHPHTLAELRRQVRTAARWLLNTNGYFTPECLQWVDPLVDLHLVDFKFGSDECARRLAGVPRYLEVLRRNLAAIYATGADRLLVRHLLMPGHESCCFEPMACWVARHLPDVRFHLAAGYVPNDRALHDPDMGRTVPMEKLIEAAALCRRLALRQVE